MVDHLFVLEGDGKILDYNGSYTEYILEKKNRTAQVQMPAMANQETPVVSENKLSYEQRKEINKLEKEIEKLEESKAELMKNFDKEGVRHEEIMKWSAELETIQKKLEEKELKWMELVDS